jgi:hypothetical protein
MKMLAGEQLPFPELENFPQREILLDAWLLVVLVAVRPIGSRASRWLPPHRCWFLL